MSLVIAKIIKLNKTIAPNTWAVSFTFLFKGRLRIPSNANTNKCPPSRTGIGNKFNIAKFIEKTAIDVMIFR